MIRSIYRRLQLLRNANSWSSTHCKFLRQARSYHRCVVGPTDGLLSLHPADGQNPGDGGSKTPCHTTTQTNTQPKRGSSICVCRVADIMDAKGAERSTENMILKQQKQNETHPAGAAVTAVRNKY